MNAMKIQRFVLMVNVGTLRVHTYASVSQAIWFRQMEHFVRTSMNVKQKRAFVEMVNVQILMDHTNAFVTLVTNYLLTDRIA